MDPYLQRCLELAQRGQSAVEPNPRVGAVVVCEGKIIGEGWHQKFGSAHAEVNAIAAVRDVSQLRNSTLYVSLEPCNHFGKTPPCCSLILEKGIPRVVVGALDPNPRMAGTSIEMLRRAGVMVEVHPDPTPFVELNRHFIFNQRQKLPFITLKWAVSSDGFIAGLDPQGKPMATAISGKESNLLVHQLRANHQAILIGSATAHIDNPSLTTRLVPGPHPIRILIDPQLEVPMTAKVFDANAKVIVLNHERNQHEGHVQWVKFSPSLGLRHMLAALYTEHQIGSILVEGGAFTLNRFLHEGCWNDAIRITGEGLLHKGVSGPESAPSQAVQETFVSGPDRIDVWTQTDWRPDPSAE